MGDIEFGKCDFCREEKPLERIYLHGCEQTDKCDGFIIIRHCKDCKPKEIESLQKKVEELKEEKESAYESGAGFLEDLKEAEQEIKELKDFAIWMTGCGYDFTQHKHFNEQRDKLLLKQNK